MTISRRTVLKGVAATLTLPWMPSLAYALDPFAPRAIDKPPRRWATVIFNNGVLLLPGQTNTKGLFELL